MVVGVLLLPVLGRPALAAPAAPSSGCSGGTEVRVVTFNAWGLPAPVATDRRGRMPRIARWVEEQGYDLAGLQELWHGAIRLFDPPGLTLGDTGGDSGLALVTPHRVVSTQTWTFDHERGFDAWKAKGLLVAEVDAGGEPLTVGVTHLQAGGGARSAEIREQQVAELLDHLPDGEPMVLMGDFNLYDDQVADDRSRARLEAAGFVDVAAEAGATEGTYPGYPDRFDRIWVRGGGRCVSTPHAEVIDPKLSDHLAVEARLLLGPLAL